MIILKLFFKMLIGQVIWRYMMFWKIMITINLIYLCEQSIDGRESLFYIMYEMTIRSILHSRAKTNEQADKTSSPTEIFNA